jgi:hypothetical protein
MWAATGITVLNVTLALYVAAAADALVTDPVWIEPGETHIITLYDMNSQAVGYQYVSADYTTTCRVTGSESYTCQRESN